MNKKSVKVKSISAVESKKKKQETPGSKTNSSQKNYRINAEVIPNAKSKQITLEKVTLHYKRIL